MFNKFKKQPEMSEMAEEKVTGSIEKNDTVLKIDDLSVHYVTRDIGTCKAVNNVSFSIKRGETIGLVGETGAGKTTIALSIMKLLPEPPAVIPNGNVYVDGEDVYKISEAKMQTIRGNKVSMIFQDPMSALNPIDTVGDQISEVILLHKNVSKAKAKELAGDMMEKVGIPRERYGEYPHQFSGGMKQRIVIAIGLACNPELLIADEPTTALDVTIQAQVLEMMNELKKELNTAVLLITHDLGIVAEMCNNVAIMYAGEIVEYGTTRQVFKNRTHPYTKGLFDSLPDTNANKEPLKPIEGLMPDPAHLPEGCAFSPRCPYATERCRKEHPELVDMGDGHTFRCFNPLNKAQ